jgi:hypothetical protein
MRLIVGLLLVALAAGCGGGEGGSSTSAADRFQQLSEREQADPAPTPDEAAAAEEALKRDIAETRRRLGRRRDFKVPQRAIFDKPDEDVWFTVIERIQLELDTPYEPDPRYERLTRGQRALYALWWANSEIGNGGFDQFYFNSTGYFAPDLPQAARLIGATTYEDLAVRANRVLAGPDGRVPRDRGAREALLDRLPDGALAPLDDGWFDEAAQLELAKLAAGYVRRHRTEFLTP